MSASSWGCELKFRPNSFFLSTRGQPLREAVSWNEADMDTGSVTLGQPLREAVSWNILAFSYNSEYFCQPLREAVSWNFDVRIFCPSPCVSLFVRLWVEIPIRCLRSARWQCQPLREAVSWNLLQLSLRRSSLLSASSWGCELKWY